MPHIMKRFRITQRRMQEEFLQTIGAHDRQEDPILAQKLDNLNDFDRNLQNIHNATLLYIDSLNAMCTASVELANSIRNFYSEDDTEFVDIVQNIVDVHKIVQEKILPSVTIALRDHLLSPTGQILTVLPQIKSKLQQRKQLQLDYDVYSNKLKEVGKDSNNTTNKKFQEKSEKAKNDLTTSTNQIISELDEIEEARPSILVSEIASLIGSQVYFFSSALELYHKLLPMFPQSSSILCQLTAINRLEQKPFEFRRQFRGSVVPRFVSRQSFSDLQIPLDFQENQLDSNSNAESDSEEEEEEEKEQNEKYGISLKSANQQRSIRRPYMNQEISERLKQFIIEWGENKRDVKGIPSKNYGWFKGKSDFTAKNSYELSFSQDELILILNQDFGDWWFGHISEERSGFFPKNLVESIDQKNVVMTENKLFTRVIF